MALKRLIAGHKKLGNKTAAPCKIKYKPNGQHR
jgi:hypothetical protein